MLTAPIPGSGSARPRECGYRHAAKALLTRERLPFVEVDLTGESAALLELSERTGSMTVPQVFVDGRFVGGFEELAASLHRGALRAWQSGAA